MAPQAGIASLEDLKGHKLGIAGGPVDKTWLLLRAYAQQTKDIELTAFVEPTYAAPPMINKLMIDGDLPAVINFWHYNARLSASGMRPLMTVEQMWQDPGTETTPPLLGWVFTEQWADENREATMAGYGVSEWYAFTLQKLVPGAWCLVPGACVLR
ncbi:hypothetical protein GCM10007159_38470 [Modicisalibacter luteus]|nr:hypothetical protein GCM10007159_38470 [Halomonas lutea]